MMYEHLQYQELPTAAKPMTQDHEVHTRIQEVDMKRTRHAFTLIELLVVISIIALLIAILLPALGAARLSARKAQSSTQLRGTHQAMVTFAQSNKGFFPGLRSSGNQWVLSAENDAAAHGSTVMARYAILLQGDYFTPDYALHPNDPQPHTAYDPNSGTPLDYRNYSYAMLELVRTNNNNGLNTVAGNSDYKRGEWRETMNSQAIIMSDRLIEVTTFADPSTYTGIWSDRPGESEWGVVWNDNHTAFERTPLFETRYTRVSNTSDDLYTRVSSGSNVQTPSGLTTNTAGGNAMMVSHLSTSLKQPF